MPGILARGNKPAFFATATIVTILISYALPGTAGASDDDPVLFYPPLPDAPRLQYLRKYSSGLDISAKSKRMRNLVFGGEEFEGHDIAKAYGVALYKGAIFVVDSDRAGYVVFDIAAGKTRFVKGSGRGSLAKPINISIDKDGTRYVTDTQREVVVVYDQNDRYARTLGKPGQFKPVDVAISGSRVYVTDAKNMKVHVLDKMTGETLKVFGEAGAGQEHLYHPTNIAVGPDETLYITDTTNFRVQHFTTDGEYIRSIGSIGSVAGTFSRPKGIALDRDGRIYVVDSAFENVQLFDNDGTPLTVFGRPGRGPGAINLPTAITVDYDNVEYFQEFAAPGFELEYVVLVASQFGDNKVAVFGFGELNEAATVVNEGGG
jgi:DNA-binding beta-propeller fold protein YncE